MSFHERFKAKVSILDKHGELKINSERAINKPSKSQVHSPLYRSIGNSVLDTYNQIHNSRNSRRIDIKDKLIPIKSKSPPGIIIKDKLSYFNNSNQVNYFFKPYSLKDYNLIKPKKYYVLGGVGPSQVGGEEWNVRMRKISKREKYADGANRNNVRRVCKSTEFYSWKNAEGGIKRKDENLNNNDYEQDEYLNPYHEHTHQEY